MDWDDLRYVLAVSGARSLTDAAKRLEVDKATVSRRIAALEESLKVRVFDRLPNGYRLTPHGERIVALAAEMDRGVTALEVDLADARGDANGIVHLSVPQFFASKVLFAAVPAFRAAHPGIELVVNASSSVLNVAQREAEVALRNVKPDQASVTVRTIGRLASAMYASPAYLAARDAPTSPEGLAHHDIVAWDRAFTFVTAFKWLEEVGARASVRVNDAAVLCDAIAAGCGVGVIPCILGDSRSDLVRLDAFGIARETIYAVAAGELRRSRRVRAVLDVLEASWRANARRLEGLA